MYDVQIHTNIHVTCSPGTFPINSNSKLCKRSLFGPEAAKRMCNPHILQTPTAKHSVNAWHHCDMMRLVLWLFVVF